MTQQDATNPDTENHDTNPNQYSLLGIAWRFCHSFRRIDDADSSTDDCHEIVEQRRQTVTEALTTGSSYIKSGSCLDAENLLNQQIIPHLTIPIIQGYVSGLINGGVGTMYAYARSILPLIDNVNEQAAIIISQNANLSQNNNADIGIINALRDGIQSMEDINCQLIGEIIIKNSGDDGGNLCINGEGNTD